ncbi:hypothetical protein [Microseira wollei]|uniref:hypothetical protein n=1 Tax=Microseira wollei TaxID=467598 RepID=UPI001CFEB1A1|nr:hypothetical protein [Microseira wollei]
MYIQIPFCTSAHLHLCSPTPLLTCPPALCPTQTSMIRWARMPETVNWQGTPIVGNIVDEERS